MPGHGRIWTPGAPFYQWSFCSVGATRPAAAMGTVVTPGNNTKGTTVQVLSSANVSRDVFGLQINANSNAVSASARDTIMDVMVDPAGGTNWGVLIPNLLISCASPYIGAFGTGINYFFPIWIKSGSSVGVRSSVNNATVGTHSCWMRCFGSPRNSDEVKVGTRVVAYGISTGTSTGTSVTAGTTSEGAYTTLGTIAAADNPWFWQLGMGINQGTITAVAYAGDLGIGGSGTEHLVIEQRLWQGTTVEQLYDEGANLFGGYYQAKNGDLVRGRLQCSGTAVTGINLGAYGVV